jgi:LmbE family N-acetylglucosaminyl deacetylase
MDRRTFLKSAVVAGAAVTLPGMLGAACNSTARRADGTPEPMPVDAFLAQGARVLWVAAHPDDECFGGVLLARASIHYRNPLAMVVMTRGDGGECCLPEGCHPDVATVRMGEMAKVAQRYRADLTHLRYWNAPLPVESFPKRHEIYAKWQGQGDPIGDVVTAIRRHKPDLLLTFDPNRGGTGHPEHQLTSRIATTAAKIAADAAVLTGGLPAHRVERTYHLKNRFWIYRMLGAADPGPITEVFDAGLPAAPGVSCADFMADATRLHRTQDNDMAMVRRIQSAAFTELAMQRVDPFTGTFDPAEPKDIKGMG